MKSLILFLGVASTTLSAATLAADRVGNGGDILLCGQPDNTFVFEHAEMLDHYEARTLRNIQRDMGPPDMPVMEKVELVLSRLDRFEDRQRAQIYRERAAHFMEEARFISNIELIDIPDSDHIGIPANCWIKQIAIQNEPQFPEDPYYVISQDLYDYLDNDGKAGLILHEIVYREALTYGHQNSKNTRYFNSYLSSDRMERLSPAQYAGILDAAKLPRLFEWEHPITHNQWSIVRVALGGPVPGYAGEEACILHPNSRVATFQEVSAAYPWIGAVLGDYDYLKSSSGPTAGQLNITFRFLGFESPEQWAIAGRDAILPAPAPQSGSSNDGWLYAFCLRQ